MSIARIIDIGRRALEVVAVVREAWRSRREPPLRMDALHVGAVTSDAVERERAQARERWPEDVR